MSAYATMTVDQFNRKFQPVIVTEAGKVKGTVRNVSQPLDDISVIADEGDKVVIINTNIITLTQEEMNYVKSPNKSYKGSNLSANQIEKVDFLRTLANREEDITYEELRNVFTTVNLPVIRRGEEVQYSEFPVRGATIEAMVSEYTSKAGNISFVIPSDSVRIYTPKAKTRSLNDLLGASSIPKEETPVGKTNKEEKEVNQQGKSF